MKKIAIMQPYFLPYIGYWQLITSVDEFIVYDNIEFTKKGWFNRNRIIDGDHDRLFTIPIKKDSDYLPVVERYLSDDSQKEITRILRVIQMTYKKAPQFDKVYPIIELCFLHEERNLFNFIHNSLTNVCNYLNISTKITVSSELPIDHSLKAEEKVIALCKSTGANIYINAIGGLELYDKTRFAKADLDLKFIKTRPIEYSQFSTAFVPWLSIVDVLMFNDKQYVQKLLLEYDLL